MIWKPKKLLEFNSTTKQWSERVFDEYREFYTFLCSQEKWPGEYNLRNTEHWRPHAIKFQKDKRYCDFNPKSKEYKEFWLLERRKCKQGIIIDGFYIPADYYFFLNFCPIPDKVKGTSAHPEVWDGHYFYCLHLELAWCENLDSVGTKARQKGYSLLHVARLIKGLWFEDGQNFKIIGYEDTHIDGEWSIAEKYKDHLNEFTGWYRNFDPAEKYNWQQRIKQTEGIIDKKIKSIGNKSRLVAAITKKSVSKAVGGGNKVLYCTEAGVHPVLEKVVEYGRPNISMGGVKTGMFEIMGAVGELKDCEPLKKYCFNPTENGFRGIKNRFNESEELIGFFHPDYWNYIYEDPDTKEIIRCYDKDGNSDIELAKHYLELEDAKHRKKGEQSYRLWKSQHPSTLEDAFDERSTNPFPTHLLKERARELLKDKPITVKLERLPTGKIIHRFVEKQPIQKINVNPEDDNSGCVVIYDFPIDNPPLGLYYAGTDPIYNIDTATSVSLMSCTIFIATHERDGKIVSGYPVAQYIGRHKKAQETYRIVQDLVEFYNALNAVECNVKDFIEWVIREGKSRTLLRRRQITVINEIMPNSTIKDEIGVRMTAEFKKRCLEKVILYVEEPIAEEFDMETGESKTIYGVSRIKDPLLIKEMQMWTPQLNTDRCFPAGTKILVPNGYKNIEDIEIGEEVISQDLTVNKVFQKHGNVYSGDMYNFRIVGQYNNLICTEEHPILVGRYSKKPCGELWRKRRDNLDIQEYIPAKDIKKGDKVFIPKRQNTKDYDLSKEFLYLAGWVFGDGYLCKRFPNQVSICFGGNEEHLAKELVDIINNNFKSEFPTYDYIKNGKRIKFSKVKSNNLASYKKIPNKNAFVLKVTNKSLADLLRYHVGNPNNKHISNEIFNNVNNLYFIAGCFASDGYLKKAKCYDGKTLRYGLEMTSIYKDCSLQIRQMLLDNGIWCTIRKKPSKKEKFNDQYGIEIQDMVDINRIGSIYNCYPAVEYTRNVTQRAYILTETGFWVSIKEVNKVKEDLTVYNIAVENTNNYIAENIAVHNCISFMMALIAAESNTNRNIIKSVDRKEPQKQTPISTNHFRPNIKPSSNYKIYGHFKPVSKIKL